MRSRLFDRLSLRTSLHDQTDQLLVKRRTLFGVLAAAGTALTSGMWSPSTAEAAAKIPHPTGSDLVLGQSNDAGATTTLSASSSTSPAPLLALRNGAASSGDGIDAYGGNNSYAVYGSGSGSSSAGVIGVSDSGYGVGAQSQSGIDFAAYGTGRMLQYQQSQVGSPSGNHVAGEAIRDHNGDLWLCISGNGSGNGTWVKVAHLAPGASSGAGGAITYLSAPVRLLDTRSGASDALHDGGGPYTSGGSPYSLTIAGVNYSGVTVPSTALGAIGNLTVVATSSGGGYVSLVPHGSGGTSTAILAYNASQVVSNSFNVALGAGALDIIIGSNPADVIVDLFAVVC